MAGLLTQLTFEAFPLEYTNSDRVSKAIKSFTAAGTVQDLHLFPH